MLQAAYFSFFKSHSDIILFWGNETELRELRDALSEMSFTGNGHHFDGQNCEIDLRLTEKSGGARRQGERSFDWTIDKRDAGCFRDLVTALIESGGPGHQYLNCATPGEITVMVSRAEYPPDLKAEPLPKRRSPSLPPTTGWALVAIALIVQVIEIARSLYKFDDRLSCDRLRDWGEWISCLHGPSHEHVFLMEIVVASWAAAGLSLLLGRVLPAFVSAIVPIVVTAFFVLFAVVYWHQAVTPDVAFGDVTLEESVRWQKIAFAITVSLLFACMVLPAAGAWLLGRHARRTRAA